jgi:hypothetical protein
MATTPSRFQTAIHFWATSPEADA